MGFSLPSQHARSPRALHYTRLSLGLALLLCALLLTLLLNYFSGVSEAIELLLVVSIVVLLSILPYTVWLAVMDWDGADDR